MPCNVIIWQDGVRGVPERPREVGAGWLRESRDRGEAVPRPPGPEGRGLRGGTAPPLPRQPDQGDRNSGRYPY